MEFLAVADAFVQASHYEQAAELLRSRGHSLEVVAWGPSRKIDLEHIIRGMEQRGPRYDASLEPIARRLAGKQGLLVDFAPVPSQLMGGIRLIGVCRATTANVDQAQAAALGIPVIAVAGRNAAAVAEFTVGLMLAESRHIARSHAHLIGGVWQKEYGGDPNELGGKTVGFIGFGSIGRAVAQRLAGFECRILYHDPAVTEEAGAGTSVPLDRLLSESDFVTVHVKLATGTRHLLGARELALMKPSAYLINTARAEIVEQAALVEALASGRIRGAALDVFVDEPLRPDSPLLTLSNVTLTPHMAGATVESLSRSPLLLVRNVLKYLDDHRVPTRGNGAERGHA